MTFVLQKLEKTAFASGAYILLNYDKCASEIAKNKTNLYKNSFCFRGFAPLTPTRELPLHPAGGFSPDPHIGSRYRARHWRMTTTYFTTTPLLLRHSLKFGK